MYNITQNQVDAIKVACPEAYLLMNQTIDGTTHIADLNRHKRKLGEAGRDLLNRCEGREMSTTDRAAYEGIVSLVDDTNHRIDLRLVAMDQQKKNAPSAWRDQKGEVVNVYKPDQQMADNQDSDHSGLSVGSMMRAMVTGGGNPRAVQALSEGTDSAGGYTVPSVLTRQLIDAMRARTVAVQAGALTVDLNTEKTTMARVESDPSPAWRLEDAAITKSEPTFGSVTFTARSLAVLIKVSRELLEDSVNIEDALMTCLAQSMALEMDRVVLMGAGAAPEPLGLSNTTGVLEVEMGTNGAQISSFAPLLNAMESTANENAAAPTAAIMAPRTAYGIAGLVDANGQPLQKPEFVKDLSLLQTTQIPVDETHGTAADASRIILGDFSKLMIGIRSGLRIELLRETFAENMQYAFLAHLRADVAVAQPKAFCQVTGIIL